MAELRNSSTIIETARRCVAHPLPRLSDYTDEGQEVAFACYQEVVIGLLAEVDQLAALLDVAEAAQHVVAEWLERGDNGCGINIQHDLVDALEKLPQDRREEGA